MTWAALDVASKRDRIRQKKLPGLFLRQSRLERQRFRDGTVSILIQRPFSYGAVTGRRAFSAGLVPALRLGKSVSALGTAHAVASVSAPTCPAP